jgi:hypothetical protein
VSPGKSLELMDKMRLVIVACIQGQGRQAASFRQLRQGVMESFQSAVLFRRHAGRLFKDHLQSSVGLGVTVIKLRKVDEAMVAVYKLERIPDQQAA